MSLRNRLADVRRARAGRTAASAAVSAYRSFDPRRVGGLECEAWVTYYRREWVPFQRAAVSLTRHTFSLPWPQTLWGAWLVLRANQLWAPFPNNDPDGARRAMQRFYRLVKRHHHAAFDPAHAAMLEVQWWREHREHQRGDEHQEQPLIDALAALYAYVYEVPGSAVQQAAEERALAMRYSDRWVDEGCVRASPLIAEERAALIRSYAALLAAVHRPG